MFINVHHQTIKTPSPKQKKHQRHNTKPSPTHHHKHHSTITTHHGDFTETCPRCHQHITETSPKHHQKKQQNHTKTTRRHQQKKAETGPRHHQNNTETSLRHHRNVIETSPRHHSKALRKQDRDITMTPLKQHRDVTETSSRHPRDIGKASRKQDRDITVTPRDITQATQNQDRHITETRPRYDREHEFFNLEAFSVDIRVTATLVCPKVHNIQIQIGIWDFAQKPDQNVHQCSPPNNQNTITKEKKQHCNINETTPSHHPLIIKASQHHQHTSPRFHRNMPETSPTHQNTWSIIRRHTSHSYTGLPKGAQYTSSNWSLRFCLETRSKCSSMFIRKSKHHLRSNKNSTATSTRQHQAITHSSS